MRLAIALLVLGCAHAARVQAQCDRSPRIVWSYPEHGAQDVDYGAPLLIRTTADITQVRITTTEVENSAVMPSIPAFTGDVILDPAIFGQYLRAGGPVSIDLSTIEGETLSLALAAGDAPPIEQPVPSLQASITGHFVEEGIDRLSLRCRSILTSATRGECVDPAMQQLVGLDVRIEDSDAGMPADTAVRAWWISGAGDRLPIMAPRLWPAACGPPAFLAPADDPNICVNLMAFGDAPTSRINFVEYCLGDGQPWPEIEEPDAGVEEPDAGPLLPPVGGMGFQQPPMMCGPCGCFVVGCDLIDPDGHGGTTGGAGTGGAGGAAGMSAGQGGAGASAGASMEGASGGRGCGCSIVRRDERGVTWWIGLFVVVARARLRARARKRVAPSCKLSVS